MMIENNGKYNIHWNEFIVWLFIKNKLYFPKTETYKSIQYIYIYIYIYIYMYVFKESIFRIYVRA